MSQVQSADAVQASGITLTGAGEFMVAIGNQTAVESPTCKVVIKVSMNVLFGTGTGNFVVTIYRGNAINAANKIYQQGSNSGIIATESASITAAAVDTLSNAAGAQYCVTATQAGATGNGSVNTAVLETMVLSG